MVAFVANAGVGMQTAITDALPKDVTVSPLPYAQQIDDEFETMKDDASFAKILDDVSTPKLTDYEHIEIDMNQSDAADASSAVEPSPEALDALEHSDVITVVDATKALAGVMFDQVAPDLQKQAEEGIDEGIGPMEGALDDMNATLATMTEDPRTTDAAAEMTKARDSLATMIDRLTAAREGIPRTTDAAAEMTKARDSLATMIDRLTAAREGIPALFDEAKKNYLASIDEHAPDIQLAYQKQLNGGFAGMFEFVAVCCAVGFVLTMLYRDSSAAVRGRGAIRNSGASQRQ